MDLWSLFRVVSQRSLVACRLEFDDRSLERASLFPLFDDEGRTRLVMITAEETGRIMLAEWTPGVYARDWARRNRLRLRFADLDDASVWDEDRFAELWHFDPWWVLGEPRYQGHGAVPALRNTNIPGFDAQVSEVGFDWDLSRASYVVKRSGDAVSAQRFTPGTLAAIARRRRAAHAPVPVAVPAGWQLRPFWRAL